jgi:hypothetical protein
MPRRHNAASIANVIVVFPLPLAVPDMSIFFIVCPLIFYMRQIAERWELLKSSSLSDIVVVGAPRGAE